MVVSVDDDAAFVSIDHYATAKFGHEVSPSLFRPSALTDTAQQHHDFPLSPVEIEEATSLLRIITA